MNENRDSMSRLNQKYGNINLNEWLLERAEAEIFVGVEVTWLCRLFALKC